MTLDPMIISINLIGRTVSHLTEAKQNQHRAITRFLAVDRKSLRGRFKLFESEFKYTHRKVKSKRKFEIPAITQFLPVARKKDMGVSGYVRHVK